MLQPLRHRTPSCHPRPLAQAPPTPHLLLLLAPGRGPLVAVETHVAVEPFLGVEHLAAVLADERAPGLGPVCSGPVLLAAGTTGRRVEEAGGVCPLPNLPSPPATSPLGFGLGDVNSNPLSGLDKLSSMVSKPGASETEGPVPRSSRVSSGPRWVPWGGAVHVPCTCRVLVSRGMGCPVGVSTLQRNTTSSGAVDMRSLGRARVTRA